MENLIVLSERNILDWLNNKGIKPHSFYTDLQAFKDDINTVENSVIMCIFSGTCKLSKRYVVSLLKEIEELRDSGEYANIKDVVILSDTFLPSCRNYYKYIGKPQDFLHYDRYKKLSKETQDVWGSYEFTNPVYTNVVLEEDDKAVMVCNIREKRLEDEVYMSLVKVSR